MYNYDDEPEEVEEEPPPPKKPRIMYNDFLKKVVGPEAFEGALCDNPLLGRDFMFGGNREQVRRKELCWTPCPAREQCYKYATENDIPFGVWGGFTERERNGMKPVRVRA